MPGFFDFLTDPSVLNMIGAGVKAYGQHESAEEKRDFGDQSMEAARFEAAQLRDRATTAPATAQRDAAEEARKARYAQSRALAVAAASGGGASDPTVINIIAGIAQEGEYRMQAALYQGEDRARLLRMQAQAREIEGASRQKSAYGDAFGSDLGVATSLLNGFSKDSMLSRFGGGGAPQAPMSTTDSWWMNDGPDMY
jgi:hypothetical protein